MHRVVINYDGYALNLKSIESKNNKKKKHALASSSDFLHSLSWYSPLLNAMMLKFH